MTENVISPHSDPNTQYLFYICDFDPSQVNYFHRKQVSRLEDQNTNDYSKNNGGDLKESADSK